MVYRDFKKKKLLIALVIYLFLLSFCIAGQLVVSIERIFLILTVVVVECQGSLALTIFIYLYR